jgi:hypothetical protein
MAELRALMSFTVAIKYGRSETALDVWSPGEAAPVARLVKDGPYDGRGPFRVLVGSPLTKTAGSVSSAGSAAYSSHGDQLGTVASSHGVLRAKRWTVHQPTLPPLIARPIGMSSVRYVFPLSLALSGTLADRFLPFRFSFQGNRSRGFVVRRTAGMRARFAVNIHDDRIDRRLVLATVVALSRWESGDVRQEFIDLTANPLAP